MRPALAIPTVVLASASELSACPFCDPTPAGPNAVKAAIFGEGFGFHLLAVAAPFLAVAGIVWIAGRRRSSSRRLRDLGVRP